jgi:hypothetical protein
MTNTIDTELIQRVDDLMIDLKAAKADLNGALMETNVYKKFFEFAEEQNIPAKACKAQALKMSLEYFKSQ